MFLGAIGTARRLTSRLAIGSSIILIVVSSSAWLASCATILQQQPPPTPITLLHLGYAARINVIFSDSVLDQLEGNWHRYEVNLTEPEHAYCLTNYTVTQRPNEMIDVHVLQVTEDKHATGDPVTVEYNCVAMPALHTHPPSDCAELNGRWSCKPGHPDIILCIPSDQDLKTANMQWRRFAILQCGRSTFTVFTPDGYQELRVYFPGDNPHQHLDAGGG